MDLGDLAALIILVPFLFGLLRYKYFNESLKWLFGFVSYGVLNEISTLVFYYYDFNDTMPKRHLYTFISFLFLGLFYNSLFRGFFRNNWILIIVILFEVYFLINSFFIQSIYEYPGLDRSISILIVVLFSILYFYKTMVETKITDLFNEPLIWINTAILIYYSGNLFFNILFKIIFEYSLEFGKLTFLYLKILNAIFYILITVGFLKVKTTTSK